MKKALLYIHGKGGNAAEAKHYEPLFPDYEVIGLDYHSQTPWEAKVEFTEICRQLCEQYNKISIIANSIGAYLLMNAATNKKIEHAYFISPIVDMEKLIGDMMLCAGISEEELEEKKQITTTFGETLSWKYLCYVRDNPLVWKVSTDILCGSDDNLTSLETISEFARSHRATLTIMKGGEHWFHTDEQMDFLDKWLKEYLK